jgi:hypothetical protein
LIDLSRVDDVFSGTERTWRVAQPACSLLFSFAVLLLYLFAPLNANGEGSAVDSKETFAFPVHKGFPVQVSGELTTSVVVEDVDNDRKLELCFNVGGKTYLIRSNGGGYNIAWPKDGGYRTPAIADIGNDEQKEILTPGPGTAMSAWKLDGSIISGWPYVFHNGGYAYDTLSVMDLDRNKSNEIMVGYGYNGNFFSILDPSGSDLTGFPIELADNISYAPGLADLNSDGIYEVIIGHDNFQRRVVAYDILGNIFQGDWSLNLSDLGLNGPVSTITVADIDGDQRPEIMFCTDVAHPSGNIDAVILNHDKTFAAGWPKVLHTWSYGGLSAGDIDGDGKLEVACATILGPDGPIDYSKVYVWNGEDGTDLPGWPKTIMNYDMTGNVIIGDLDGDGERELLIAGFDYLLNKTQVFAWHGDGSDVAGFPLTIDNFIVYGSSSCFIADIDNDGLVEIGIGVENDNTNLSRVYVWDLPYPYQPKCQDWPQYRHDAQHTGNYHFPEGLPILPQVPDLPWPTIFFLLVALSGVLSFRTKVR